MLKYKFSLPQSLRDLNPLNPFFTISSIIIVGGVLGKHLESRAREEWDIANPDSLSKFDMLRLCGAVHDLMMMGVRISELEIQLCDKKYGDDFVDNPQSADLIIWSWINKCPDFPDTGESFSWESPALRDGKTWSDALLRASPPFLAVSGREKRKYRCVSRKDVPQSYIELKLPEGKKPHYMYRPDNTLHIRPDII